MEPRRHTATHQLDGISWQHVSNSNGAQEAHSSAIQMEARRHTATHILDGISWQHVSNSNGAQEAHSNSQTEWNFTAACQQFKWSPEHAQQLTTWMGFDGSMSAIQMKPRRHTATHHLDVISWQHVSNSNGAQEAHSNSLAGWYFMAACQQFK